MNTEIRIGQMMTVEYDLSPAMVESKLRDKLVELGWTPPAETACTVPPRGWHCTRAAGHDGPCAAWPAEDAAAQADGDPSKSHSAPVSAPMEDLGTLRKQRDDMLAALQAVAREVTDGVRPHSTDSYLPASVVRLVHEAIAGHKSAAANAAGLPDAGVLFNGFDITKLPPILISCVAKLWPGSNGLFWEVALERMPERINHLMATRAAAADTVALPRELAQRCLSSMRQAVAFGETGKGRPPAQTCLFEIEELDAILAARAAVTSAGDMPTVDQATVDKHLDAVLRASGSALRHYSMRKTLDDMRAAMRAAMARPAANGAPAQEGGAA